MQGKWVQPLVWENFTCCGATKPGCHNHWDCALEPTSRNHRARVLELLKPTHLEPPQRSDQNEKTAHHKEEWPLFAATKESWCKAMKTQHSQN